MDEVKARQFIQKQKWIFAKTYAQFAPHEYVMKLRCNGTVDEFNEFGQYIQEHGMRMFYYKNERKYLLLDGYFYWVCGEVTGTHDASLNRCRPEDYDIAFVRRNTWIIKCEKEKRKAPEQEKLF